MGKFILITFAILLVAGSAGAVVLMFWDIPAPTARVERIIPDARFPR
jgi:small neutral amino acid transporter SnatA (MarC family)